MWQPCFFPFVLLAAGFANADIEPAAFLLLHSQDGKSQVVQQASTFGRLQRFLGLSILEISLIIVLVVAVACGILLVRKFQNQDARIQQLQKRIQGLHHVHMDNERHLTRDEEKKTALERQLARKEGDFQKKGPSMEAKQKIENIHSKGRVFADFEKQLITINQPIAFQKQTITENKTPPKPAFANLAQAREVIEDLAGLLYYLEGTVVLVEGHTGGGVDAIGEVFFEVASQRAELVMEMLVEFGTPPSRLECRGRPGIIGDNMNDVKLVTLSWCA